MTPPVNFIAVRTMAIVQELIKDEAFGRPGACDERQLRCQRLVKWNLFGFLIVIVFIANRVFASEIR